MPLYHSQLSIFFRIFDIRWLWSIWWLCSSYWCWGVGSLHWPTLQSDVSTRREIPAHSGSQHSVWRVWQRQWHLDILPDPHCWGELGENNYTARGEVIWLIFINYERNYFIIIFTLTLSLISLIALSFLDTKSQLISGMDTSAGPPPAAPFSWAVLTVARPARR